VEDGPEEPARAAVVVAQAQNQAEAELIQGLLQTAGVPSLVRRAAAFDVPDFLAAGAREILVPASAADLARELLRPGADRTGG
jgi:hypothetical protein